MTNEDFFSDLVGELHEQDHSAHPPGRVLRRYLQRRLPDGERFSEEVAGLLGEKTDQGWTLAEVSLHVATCRECAGRAARVRRAANRADAPSPGRRDASLRPRTWKRRLAYFVPVVSVILGLILLLLFWTPSQSATQYYTFGALAM